MPHGTSISAFQAAVDRFGFGCSRAMYELQSSRVVYRILAGPRSLLSSHGAAIEREIGAAEGSNKRTNSAAGPCWACTRRASWNARQAGARDLSLTSQKIALALLQHSARACDSCTPLRWHDGDLATCPVGPRTSGTARSLPSRPLVRAGPTTPPGVWATVDSLRRGQHGLHKVCRVSRSPASSMRSTLARGPSRTSPTRIRPLRPARTRPRKDRRAPFLSIQAKARTSPTTSTMSSPATRRPSPSRRPTSSTPRSGTLREPPPDSLSSSRTVDRISRAMVFRSPCSKWPPRTLPAFLPLIRTRLFLPPQLPLRLP